MKKSYNDFKKLLNEIKINAICMEHEINVCVAEKELSYYDDEPREFYNNIEQIKSAIDILEILLKYNGLGLKKDWKWGRKNEK